MVDWAAIDDVLRQTLNLALRESGNVAEKTRQDHLVDRIKRGHSVDPKAGTGAARSMRLRLALPPVVAKVKDLVDRGVIPVTDEARDHVTQWFLGQSKEGGEAQRSLAGAAADARLLFADVALTLPVVELPSARPKASEPKATARDAIIERLYRRRFTERDPMMPIDELSQGLDPAAMDAAIASLRDEGLIEWRPVSGPPYHRLTAPGVALAEQQGLAPVELATIVKRVRLAMLECYSPTASEGGEVRPRMYWETACGEVARTTEAPEVLVSAVHQLLWDDQHLVALSGVGFFEIGFYGLEFLREARERKGVLDAFEQVRTTSNPQRRGQLFQGWFGQLVGRSGWSVSESVKTPGEEIDLVLHRDDVYYFAECRWWAERIEPDAIRDFAGKIEARRMAGIRGLFVSMSGFTDNAARCAAFDAASPIVLFGPRDVVGLASGELSFDELLSTKLHERLVNRRSVWA